MTKIIGQIESLKKIRSKLNENGITGFNSVKDIKDYLSTYKSKEKQILIISEPWSVVPKISPVKWQF